MNNLAGVTDLGWILGVVLIVILSAKEMVRAYGGPQTGEWMRRSDRIATPLLVLFALVLVVRIAIAYAAG